MADSTGISTWTLGTRISKAQPVAASILRRTTISARGLFGGLATPGGKHAAFFHAVGQRILGGGAGRVFHWSGNRVVARDWLLVASGAAIHRAFARHGMAADGILHIAVELERECISDRVATGFPVAVLTWSGIAGVNAAYYDVARTLGARPVFLILKVAVPAAMPSVFVHS